MFIFRVAIQSGAVHRLHQTGAISVSSFQFHHVLRGFHYLRVLWYFSNEKMPVKSTKINILKLIVPEGIEYKMWMTIICYS